MDKKLWYVGTFKRVTVLPETPEEWLDWHRQEIISILDDIEENIFQDIAITPESCKKAREYVESIRKRYTEGTK